MKIKRLVTALLAFVISASLFAGCGTNQAAAPANTATSTQATTDATTASAKTEPVTLTMFAEKSMVDQSLNKIKDDFEKQNQDIKIEYNVLPGEGNDGLKKQDLAVMSGNKTDLVVMPNPNAQTKYVNGKLLTPLNDMAKAENYDMDKVYGKYLDKDASGNVYYLPNQLSLDIVFYNKKIFDDAKVPYPTGDWTWDQYVDIAKKLNNPSKGVYGSLMELDWEYYNYITANQKKVAWYKPDGTSNFDDPAFKDALKWVGDLSAVHKIQPSLPEFKAKKLQFDTFMSGKYGMEMIGSWFVGCAMDYTKYPRDWKIGVCSPPTPADGKNVLGAGSSYGINVNAAHPKEAFKYLKYLAENNYKISGGMPARADLSKNDIMEFFQSTSEKLKGEVTAEDLYNACYNPNLGLASEKIVGTASAAINEMYAQEAENYLFGKQTLDDTMKSIKTKADALIKSDGNK